MLLPAPTTGKCGTGVLSHVELQHFLRKRGKKLTDYEVTRIVCAGPLRIIIFFIIALALVVGAVVVVVVVVIISTLLSPMAIIWSV